MVGGGSVTPVVSVSAVGGSLSMAEGGGGMVFTNKPTGEVVYGGIAELIMESVGQAYCKGYWWRYDEAFVFGTKKSKPIELVPNLWLTNNRNRNVKSEPILYSGPTHLLSPLVSSHSYHKIHLCLTT
jgi:hypothetical protein